MFPLDSRTVERLAKVIVDIDGPYERKGWEVEGLLERAAWPGSPEYDGSPRIQWLIEEMKYHSDDEGALERLLCRVCDPLEYDEGLSTAEQFRLVVNEHLLPEGLAVSHEGVQGRPVLGTLRDDGSVKFSEPPELEKRIEALVNDKRTATTLVRRVEETRICEQNGAYTMAVIGIGSLVEGLLLSVLMQSEGNTWTDHFNKRRGNPITADQVSLAPLIDVMHKQGLIQHDAKRFLHEVRNFRNYIHPNREIMEQPDLDADSVMLCWAPVHAVLNDLEQRIGDPIRR
ncbi:hypothetical protein [Nocardiopsis alba]|uniref:hypothetical protein n=1 Tax=Nocardiopsis alba TaxID=53437 RepID=UPI0035DE35DE